MGLYGVDELIEGYQQRDIPQETLLLQCLSWSER